MAKTFDQLYALTVPEIQKIFLQVMSDIVDRAMLDEMVKAIEANDVDALFQASGFTPAVLGPIVDRIEQAYKDGGENTVDGWPKRIRTPFGIVQPMFNMRNPAVEQDLREYSSQLITRISDEMRESVRIALETGLIKGDNPRTTALDIVGRKNMTTGKREGGLIGLANNQIRWSLTARRYLESLDQRYFTLSLRDKRFDATVRKAIEAGKPLTADVVSKLIVAYNNRALKYRGEMVARTETLQSLNRGQVGAIEQAIDEGNITRDQVKKWWANSSDSRVRDTHKVAGTKYSKAKAIDMGEPFLMASGARMMFPGDQSLGAPAGEVIMCRCHVKHSIDFFKPLRDRNE